jgi:hypothetical protein
LAVGALCFICLVWLFFNGISSSQAIFKEVLDIDPPASVKNLVAARSGGLSEHRAVILFDIAPRDLDDIIAREKLIRTQDSDRIDEIGDYAMNELKRPLSTLGSTPSCYYRDLKPVADQEDASYSMHVILLTNSAHNRAFAAYAYWQ